MPRRELDAFGRQQVEEGIVTRRQHAMHGLEHALVLVRTGHGENLRIARGNLFGFGAHAAGHDYLAILGKGLADRGERFRLRAVEEAARIDDREISAGVRAGQFISLGTQARDDPLAVDQRLRTAERDEAYFRRAPDCRGGMPACHRRGA